ncbi:hypothetical protein BUALT_Bualt06G0001000 [Buddleja alternifolia]|uniref:Glycosyltransferase family 92 protein n=1 Tax=Buddleja alternifolia TaxID=168488 RepID=A0AAV6XJV8_9LAMI|nr:hypothetical protein BUALT_Bualt06G0001000 [Buddleja alternifolia]
MEHHHGMRWYWALLPLLSLRFGIGIERCRAHPTLDKKGRSRTWCCTLFPAASLFFLLFLWSSGIAQLNKQKLFKWSLQGDVSKFTTCQNRYMPPGSEMLPKGIVAKTSNLERRPLWGYPKKANSSRSLFAAAVGIKQKENVDKIVRKFLESNFIVMLFHYDGIVDEWKEFEWSNSAIHVSADNQTKWWFAKRFLHPDIVAMYDYIFLWDEDLGVEHFHPERYLSIVKEEGFEISQPALEIGQSEVHHLITARRRSKVHRRIYKQDGKGIQCDEKSNAPPCTGWIEVMAPVFSRAAWRCVWYMIQGERSKNIGVVDAEYIAHYGLPTLGEQPHKDMVESQKPNAINQRIEVRRQSYNEYKIFKRRWKKAVDGDKCWTDPYPNQGLNHTSIWSFV